jgi:hypothetical protein
LIAIYSLITSEPGTPYNEYPATVCSHQYGGTRFRAACQGPKREHSTPRWITLISVP